MKREINDLNDMASAFLEGEEFETETVSIETTAKRESVSDLKTPIARPLIDISQDEIDETKTLLGNRFLCAQGGMLYIGPSGIGKSSSSCQQDILWGIGREAFGIAPKRPLRILTIQSENDDGDLIEMSRGVLSRLFLNDAEKELLRENVLYATCRNFSGEAFFERDLVPLLKKYKVDIIRIDPFQGFLGDDPKATEAVINFLQSGLNPLMEEYGFATIICHHTPKTNFRDTTEWKPTDWMYAGAGAAAMTNWARAIMVIDPLSDGSTFKFIGAKRGSRIGWKNEDGKMELIRLFAHAKESGAIYWRELSKEEESVALSDSLKTKGKAVPPKDEEVISLLPQYEKTPKSSFQNKIQSHFRIGEKKAFELIKRLVDEEKIFVHTIKRPKTNALKLIARFKQGEVSESLTENETPAIA